MKPATARENLIDEIAKLSDVDQQRVLEFARGLSPVLPAGEPGTALLQFVGLIPAADLKEIETAILEDCERIDASGW